jgi:non-ribosomal peptide synthetase component F
MKNLVDLISLFMENKRKKRFSYNIGNLADMTLNRILPEFQEFLLSHRLVPEKNAPYYARWVSRFLAFSNKSRHLDHDTLTSEFMHSLKSEENIGKIGSGLYY